MSGDGPGDGKPESTADSDGGCVPDDRGRMTGIPLAHGADPEHLDLPPYEPHPLGPKPITPGPGASSPGASGSGRAGSGPIGGLVPVGPRGFNGLQAAIGRDHMGAVLTYMPEDDAPGGAPRPGAPRPGPSR